MKKILFFILIFFLCAFGVSAVLNLSQKNKNNDKITVVTTLFPLYDFVKNIGGDKVSVSLLLPPGVEAHAFEPKAGDMMKINDADLFVYTSQLMEPWAKDILQSLSVDQIKVIEAGLNTNLILATFHDEDEPVGAADPHIWLDFANVEKMVDNITDGLVEKDPVNAEYYLMQAKIFKNKIFTLDNKYQVVLGDCQNKEIVYGGHYAFGYLANRYGLKYTAAQGVSPDAEPSAKDLIVLVKQIKDKHIGYIFYEELASPKIAETIAKETGAKMLLLNAAHNLSKEDFDNDISFIEMMESNLNNLSLGLGCNK